MATTTTEIPTSWTGVVGDAIGRYIDLLQTSPYIIHFTIIIVALLGWYGYLLYRYKMKQMEERTAQRMAEAQSQGGGGVPLETLMHVIAEASQQTATSMDLVNDLTLQVGSLAGTLKDLARTVEDIKGLVKGGNFAGCPYADDTSLGPRRRQTDQTTN